MINAIKTTLLLSYICIASISATIITPALPQIQHFFALPKGSVEWIVSIFLIGYVVGQLIYAPIANRYGRLTALRSGLIINLVGIVICIFSVFFHSFAGLLAGRLITALGAASGLSCTLILINELLPTDRAKQALSLSIVSFTIGVGLSIMFGSLLTQYGLWQDCFILLFVHGLIMYALTYQFPETLTTPISIHPKIIASQYARAFSHPTVLIFSLALGFTTVFSYCYSASASLYTQKILHLSPGRYGYWNNLNILGMLCGGFLSAYLMKKLSPKAVLLVGLLLVFFALPVLSWMAFFHINDIALYFAVSSYLFLTTGILFASGSYFASNAIPDRASASSVMSFLNMGSATLSVIVMGYLPFAIFSAFTAVLCGYFIIVALCAVYEFRRTAA